MQVTLLMHASVLSWVVSPIYYADLKEQTVAVSLSVCVCIFMCIYAYAFPFSTLMLLLH